MKVKELIELLKKLPKDDECFVLEQQFHKGVGDLYKLKEDMVKKIPNMIKYLNENDNKFICWNDTWEDDKKVVLLNYKFEDFEEIIEI